MSVVVPNPIRLWANFGSWTPLDLASFSVDIIIIIIIIITTTNTMAQLVEMMRVTLFGSRNDAPDSKGTTFDPAQDIPSLAGKVILVTGAAGDLGRTTAVQLARYGRPARIYVADLPCNDPAKKKALLRGMEREAAPEEEGGEAAATRTEFRFLDLDLGSFTSVQACVADFLAREERLDVLVLNAGIIRVAPGTTAEGYEAHFGINYLGHALLARLLVPTLARTAEQARSDVRVVVVSSEGHAMAPKGGVQFEALKGPCAQMVGDGTRPLSPTGFAHTHGTSPTPSATARARSPSSRSPSSSGAAIPRCGSRPCTRDESSRAWPRRSGRRACWCG